MKPACGGQFVDLLGLYLFTLAGFFLRAVSHVFMRMQYLDVPVDVMGFG